jgi:hypothetical protein
MNLDEATKFNQIIMPDLGNIIADFYQLLSTNKSDPLIIPGRIYKPIHDKLFWLRTVGGRSLFRSIGHPQTTYQILSRFQDIIGKFHEEKGFFGSTYSCPRHQVLEELASIKEFAGWASSQILHKFK